MTVQHLAHSGVGQSDRLTTEAILDVFDLLGLRNTRPRRLIAERLAHRGESGATFAVQDFWEELQALDPRIGRATVYRTVEVLVEQGILDRVPAAAGTYHYRVCSDGHHHHVRCVECHQVVEVEACLPAELFTAMEEATNFSIDGHSLELFGRCANCQNDQSSSESSASAAWRDHDDAR
ncbi:MAG: hypothetical protein NVS4B2_21650 [Chloroflexota bacterium]